LFYPDFMERLRASPLTLILLGINSALFAAEEIFRYFFNSSLFPEMALSRVGLAEGNWWQLITYAFLHGNLLHLLVNMVALWFTGPLLEELLSGLCYFVLYFGGVLAGGLLQTFASGSSVDLVGASGAVCALLVGFATLLPRLKITALIFFVIPVRMRAATLGWLVIVGSFLFWLFGIERGIGHLAHLGGGIAGFLLCRIFLAFGLVRPLEMEPPPME
jgi:membrane associated rhomboid family serine protease